MAELHAEAPAPLLPPPRVVPVWRVFAVAFTIAILIMVLVGWFSLQFVETLDRTSITVTFKNANGLKIGADVRFREIKIGVIKTLTLSRNKDIVAGIDLDKGQEDFATDNAVYWIAHARLDLHSGASSLGTLFTGSYIIVDLTGQNGATAGQASQRTRRNFTGLEQPPAELSDERGEVFNLAADDLGSLDIGSPVYFRRVQVGRVVSYKLNGPQVALQIFIQRDYLKLVTDATCFWQASGLDFSAGADGYHLRTASLFSLVAGGIEFEQDCRDDADRETKSAAAKPNREFTLFPDRNAGTPNPPEPPTRVVMHFDGSARGITPGASVDFLGVLLGKVDSVRLDYDPKTRHFPVVVQASVYPQRLGRLALDKLPSDERGDGGRLNSSNFFRILVDAGLRAHMRAASLLTGQLYIALDFPDKATKVKLVERPDGSLELPTVGGDSFNDLAPRLNDIAAKIQNLPFDQVAGNLSGTLSAARTLLTTLTPAAQEDLKAVRTSLDRLDHTLLTENAPMQQNLAGTLDEIRRAARSMRVMADYLQNHPDLLLRGHGADPAMPALQPQAAR